MLRQFFCKLFILVFYFIKLARTQQVGFNAAIGSSISANVTCGSPPEQYFNTRQGYVNPRDRVLSLCNASDPKYAHPASNMIDGQSSTFWQGANNVSDAFITIKFKEAILVKTLKFTFGDYRRPGQIAIYKSTDYGRTFSPWHYQVTSLAECTSVFKIPTNLIFQYPDRVNRTICVEYQNYPLEYDEVVTVQLNGDQRGDGSANFDSPELRRWLNVTDIHIWFTGLFRKFDFIDTRWHHYVVREIDVMSVCDCSGHGNGLVCPVNSKTGLRECQCLGNTCGNKCDRCCPGFNQYPWKPSTAPSWGFDPASACEQCNCFDHSSECVYNATVDSLRLSLDIKGNYSGGGVCVLCKDNTEGINCQNCQRFFYRPEGRARNLTNSCIGCGCFANGTTNQSGFSFLECIRDESQALNFPGKKSGDCFCKQNVNGRTCNQCKNEYYRLEGTNQQGCLPCSCLLPGTVNRNATCKKDFNGQCSCKANVQLRDCSECKDGFYGLLDSDISGCRECSCDVGASSSPTCNKTTGQCHCRSYLFGRTCLSVLNGYYYPSLHFIFGSRNLFVSASASLSTTISVPKTTLYRIYVAYSMSTNTNIVLTLRLQKGTFILSNGNFPTTSTRFCATECFAMFTVSATNSFNLALGTWNVTVSSSISQSQLKIERVILIPQTFFTASILSSINRSWFQSNCNVTNNDMRIGTANEQRCLSHVYSLTTYFNNGALPCSCNVIGSVNQTCQTYAGQCHCKPGVDGRDCSYCRPGFYNFSSSGCTPCSCKGLNKICDPVTGVCQCPNNTIGRVCDPCACNNNSNECFRNGDCFNCAFNTTSTRCELCREGFFGDAKTQSCRACGCHVHGSLNQSCDTISGQCNCKAGVVGLRCDRCLPNYYGLISTGCFPCNCNIFGSSSTQCASNGQCPCKSQASGLRCDVCIAGYFGLPAKSCQPCSCDPVGTITGTVCNRDITGQCQCRSGVTGRTCNQCMKQYVNFSSSGCQRCSLCTRLMQASVDVMKTELVTLQTRVNETKNMSLLQAEIVRMQTNVNNLQVAAVMYDQRITKGQSDYQYLTTTFRNPLTQRHSTLLSSISSVTLKANSLTSTAISNVERMKTLETAANNAASLTRTAASTASSVFGTLASITSSSDTLVSNTYKEIQKISLSLHQSMLTSINADLALSQAARNNVSAAGQSAQSQQSFSNSMTSSIQESSANLTLWNSTWRQQLPQFLSDIQNVYRRGSDVLAIINSTRILILQQEQYMAATRARQLSVQEILQQATSVYTQSLAVFEQTKFHTTTVSGTLQVSILQHLASTLTVKVLNGRNLVARDFPSQLSDPYFTVSIKPDWNSVGSKQSRHLNGTLNPNWSIEDSYMFALTREQLPQTSVVINIFDKDTGNPDDFMGEVIISLASLPGILTGTVTNTYSVRPKGYDLIWSGSFSANQNSLVDVQQILSSQISTIETLMTQAEGAATQAQTAANNLQSQANLLSTSFTSAKSHASAAVNAVNTYREIYRLINSSLETAKLANNSANEILKLMQSLSLSNLQAKADASLAEAQALLATSTARNVSVPYIVFYLRSETLRNSDITTPRSIIEIEGVDYSKHLNGFNIVVIDSKTGVVESSVNFRVDVDQSATMAMVNYLDAIPGQKMVAMVKQSHAEVSSLFQAMLIGQLMSLGAIPPIWGGTWGSYALLGYKKTAGESVTWVRQVGKNEGRGASEIRQTVPLRSTLMELVTSANATFQSAWPYWQEVNSRFTTLQSVTERFLLTESIATIVQSSLQAANIILKQATDSASRVLLESIQFNRTIYEITLKYNQIVFMVGNASSLISNATSSVSQAETRLPFQFNNVNTAKTLSSQINSTSQRVSIHLSSMESKLARLKTLTSQIPFAIQFDVSSSVVYQLQGYTNSITKVFYNDIGFDFKANASNGLVFYIISQPGRMQHSIGLYLQNGFVHLIYHLGFGQTVIRNDMKITLNQWYYVHVARQGKRGILTIRHSSGVVNSAQGESIYSGDSNTMDFTSASRVYLGGFAPGFMTSIVTLYGQYSGIIDNLEINTIKYNLWSQISFFGSPSFAATRYGFRPTISGTWISFFGNGALQLRTGPLQINADYSAVQLEFRTLRDNVVVLGVTNIAGSFVYALYLIGGKLLFQFSSGVGQNAALITQRNTYVDGRWYRVTMTRTSINATLSATLVGSTNAVHTETVNVFAQTQLPQGFRIILGAPPSTSSQGLPTTGTYAGDIRNFYVSYYTTKQMQLRSFNSADRVSESGTSYYGMVAGQVVAGVHFYGFMWWKNFGSYAALVPDSGMNLMTSLSLVFKTTQLTGTIMYSSENTQYLRNQGALVYFYVALFGGNLVITLHDSNFATLSPYLSQNLTLSDGRWHNVSLNYIVSSFRYQLHVDGVLVHSGWFGNFQREIAASNPLYFGGIPASMSIPFAIPTRVSLEMDVQSLIINSRIQNFHSSTSYGVSYAGVAPSSFAPLPPGPLPTCGAGFSSPVSSTEVNQIQFGNLPWLGRESYIGYNMSEEQKRFFKSSFVVTIDFKATSKDGIVFYTADNATAPTQHICLELVNGRLQFRFGLGANSLMISTTNDYADGKWHLIHMLRINTFGAILLPISKEYQSNHISTVPSDIGINTPLYIGGIPNSVNAPVFSGRRTAFNGCIRRFEIASSFQFFSLNLAAPDIRPFSSGPSSCYINIEPGTFFNGSGWIFYANNFQLGANFSFSISFKTNKRSGVLFYLFSNDTQNGAGNQTVNARFIVAELNHGKIYVNYKPMLNEAFETAIWSDPKSNSSYLICDQQWHNLQIKLQSNAISITVDSVTTSSSFSRSGNIAGNLYIGGVPSHIVKPGSPAKFFGGCLKSIIFNTRLQIYNANFGKNVQLGCPT
ncbi:laminin subunit alpha-1-like [Rhopilema esculentum]|uniref:laminin subunit alpha-1-like n=1 Tax=Rhopilema esculentum TaxID=499914 RepID=UPI0031CEF023